MRSGARENGGRAPWLEHGVEVKSSHFGGIHFVGSDFCKYDLVTYLTVSFEYEVSRA